MTQSEENQDPKHRRPARNEEELHPSARAASNPGHETPDEGDELDALDDLAALDGSDAADGDDEGEEMGEEEGDDALGTTLRDDMHIESADELDEIDDLSDLHGLDELGDLDEYVDEVTAARGRFTVAQLLQRLRTDAESLDLRDLFVFSDLSRGEMALVEAELALVPVAHRRRLLRELTLAVDDFLELDLSRLLRVAMRDADATVRRLAIEGLWEETDPELLGPLVSLLAGDDDHGVRAAAAAALGAFVLAGELEEMDSALTMRAEQALLNVLQTPGEPVQVQGRALESLAFSSEAGLRQLIEDAYYAPEEELRLSALRAMGRSADTRWRRMARAELSSPDASMRAEAARACGELEARAATQEIIDLLEDSSADVRLAAIDALGHLGGKEARDALRLMANEGEEAEAAAAEVALEEMGFFAEAGAVPLYDEEADEADDDPDSNADSPWGRAPAPPR